MKNIIVSLVCTIALLSVTTVDAKSFKSKSRSRSSSSGSGFSSLKRVSYQPSNSSWGFGSKEKTTESKTKDKTKPTSGGTQKTDKSNGFGFKKSVNAGTNKFNKPTLQDKQQRAQAKKVHNDYVSKFKKKPTVTSFTPTERQKYINNDFVNKSYGYDSGTRLTRRSSYYNSYQPPVYVYNSSPSFGMWDSMMLWYMLDNASDRNQYQMAYNYQNDAGYREWRREADRLALENADMKAKLTTLDNNVASMKGQPIDNTYTPNGMDRDLMLADNVIDNIKPSLTMCSGSANGSYSIFANKMKRALDDNFVVTVLPSTGSTANMKALDNGTCDVALVQRDAYDLYTICSNAIDDEVIKVCNGSGIEYTKGTSLNYTRLASPFVETVFGVCKGVDNLGLAKSIALPNGSGNTVTWNNLIIEFPHLGDIPVVVTKNNVDSLSKIKTGEATCTVITTSIKSKIVKKLDSYIDRDTHVVNFISDELKNIKDPVDDTVYNYYNVPETSFGKAGEKYSTGLFNKTIRTINIQADLIISNKYNKALADKVGDVARGIKL